MKALRTIPIRIPIEVQRTKNPRVVDGSKYTGIYLSLREKEMGMILGRTHRNNLIVQ